MQLDAGEDGVPYYIPAEGVTDEPTTSDSPALNPEASHVAEDNA